MMNEMKKLLIILVGLTISFGGFFAHPAYAQASDELELIEQYDVRIDIRKDGTIGVREAIDYNFGSQLRHGIFRTIPYRKTNEDGKQYEMNIENVHVEDTKGAAYPFATSKDDGELTLKIGDPDRTISGEHTYVVSYDVSGALTYFSDHDELYWNAAGQQWPVSITDAQVTVKVPQPLADKEIRLACFTGVAGSTIANCKFSQKGDVMTFLLQQPLNSNEGMTVVAGFPKGVVAVVEPRLYTTFWDSVLGKLVGFGGLLLALWWYVGYPIRIVYKWWREGRDPQVAGSGVVSAWYDPPKAADGRSLSPAETGAIIDETVHDRDVVATIIDLARRGYMRIEERKKKDFYLIKQTPRADTDIQEVERKFLDSLLGDRQEIRVKDTDMISEFSTFKKQMYTILVKDGYFPRDPSKVRLFYQVMAVAALATLNMPLALASSIFGRAMSRRNPAGVRARHVAESLKGFLGSQKRQLKFQADKQMMFERLLPYAIAFGVEKVWAKRFDSMKLAQPSWYKSYGSKSSLRAGYLASSLSNMNKAVVAAATPTRSSSGFSSGFSGGSSGGGGGGGGGGSW